MDKFSLGAIIIAVIIEAFIVWGRYNNNNESDQNLILASILPIVLVATVLIVHYLQRGAA